MGRTMRWVRWGVLLVPLLSCGLPTGGGSSKGCSGGNSDNTPPAASTMYPADGADGVYDDSTVGISFTESLEYLTADQFRLLENGDPVACDFSFVYDHATLTPLQRLKPGTTYEVVVSGGLSDFSGNHTKSPIRWSFTTAVAGPGAWTDIPPFPGAAPNAFPAAVWTGSEMIVWYGELGNAGYRYHPATRSWRAISAEGAPLPLHGATAVWTGSEMIVWGGSRDWYGDYTNIGGCYDPATDSWRPLPLAGAPLARGSHAAVWSGSEMIVYGGVNGEWPPIPLNTGAAYDPLADAWRPLSTLQAPATGWGSAVWTGSRMIVYGSGIIGTYHPVSDSWQTLAIPESRQGHAAVWSGSEMLVWGGHTAQSEYVNSGWRYDPVVGTIAAMSVSGAPDARSSPNAVWSGEAMILWGGYSTMAGYKSGGIYDPSTDSWLPTALNGAPKGREGSAAVWTGSGMAVFGGTDGGWAQNDGGIFTPP